MYVCTLCMHVCILYIYLLCMYVCGFICIQLETIHRNASFLHTYTYIHIVQESYLRNKYIHTYIHTYIHLTVAAWESDLPRKWTSSCATNRNPSRYVCMYVCMGIWAYVYVSVCICMYVCVSYILQLCMYVCMCVGTGSECLQRGQEENVNLDQRLQQRRIHGHVQRFDVSVFFRCVCMYICMHVCMYD